MIWSRMTHLRVMATARARLRMQRAGPVSVDSVDSVDSADAWIASYSLAMAAVSVASYYTVKRCEESYEDKSYDAIGACLTRSLFN